MGTHESSVNYQNLIRDLAEMYTFDVAEVVIVELIANSLDAKATCISIDYDPGQKILIVTDNGSGMTAHQFDQYHDFAAGLKTRGDGIGFAGVGAKISFNIADRVITETRSKAFSGGSNWHLESKKRLLWDDVPATHLLASGTRVEVRFRPDAKPPYSSTEDLINLVRRHYLPLLDRRFLDLYQQIGHYSVELRIAVNNQTLELSDTKTNLELDKTKEIFPAKAGKMIGYGIFGLASSEYPVAQDICGVLLCTHGKVIKADLFNQFPGSLGPKLFGLVEIPTFVNFLTTSKTDFIRGPGRHREFEQLYNPVRQAFKAWLTDLGIQTPEVGGADEAGKLERELRKLVDDVPELSDFFGFRTKKSVLLQDDAGAVRADITEGIDVTFPLGEGIGEGGQGPTDTGEQAGETLTQDQVKGTQLATPISRVAKKGPRIAFVEAPDRVDLAWVDGNSVVINSGHPSYARVHSDNNARRILSLCAIGSAIQRFLASGDDPKDLMFVDRMMAAWGRK